MATHMPHDTIDSTLGHLDTTLRAFGLKSGANTLQEPFRSDRAAPHPLNHGARILVLSVNNTVGPAASNGERYIAVYGYAELDTEAIKGLPPGTNGGAWMGQASSQSRTTINASITRVPIKNNGMRPMIVIYDEFGDRRIIAEAESTSGVKAMRMHDLYHAAKPGHEPAVRTLSELCGALGITVPREALNVRDRAQQILAATVVIAIKAALTTCSPSNLAHAFTPDGLLKLVSSTGDIKPWSKPHDVQAASGVTQVPEQRTPDQNQFGAMASSFARKDLVLPIPLAIESRSDFENYSFKLTKYEIWTFKNSGGKKIPKYVSEVVGRYEDMALFLGYCTIARAEHHGYPEIKEIIKVGWIVKGPISNWVRLATFLAARNVGREDMPLYASEIIKLRNFVSAFYAEMAKALPDSKELAEKTEGHEAFVRTMRQFKAILERGG
ncbi:hypothetical protein LTR17_016562 [Elasticomyces elasticus]|nr:hypothetical protein LTR17_016562 [Elasticomyces elasticus]